jgi:23S rRNA U2552 (ribose-2'-O)-methylase RlmE/FtsJ
MERVVEKPPWSKILWTSNTGIFNEGLVRKTPSAWKEDINSELFALKERIRPFDRTELWDLAKRITNIYERIHSISSRLTLPPSICLITPLSRSFFKMIEILNVMRFFETKTRVVKLRSLHLCEGPGGFIEALYYKAEQVKKSISCALGMTLRSNHQMIPGWRKATNFLQKNPSIKLIYGSTNTGDIYDPQNQEYLKDLCKGKPVYLVTADGGFDFSDDFHAQERMIFRLLVSSSIIALQTLANDGDFVLKIFDIQSQTTRDFLTLVGSCFREWTIYKPVTSRPCNSEWYFIGLAACFNRSKVIDYLLYIRDCLERDQTFGSLLEHNVREEFLQILQKERVERQSLALQNVLKYCDEPRSLDKNNELWKQQIEPSKNWCSIFKIPCIF